MGKLEKRKKVTKRLLIRVNCGVTAKNPAKVDKTRQSKFKRVNGGEFRVSGFELKYGVLFWLKKNSPQL
jgi:hypothetical protein